MAHRLRDNLNSQYVAAANRLRPRKAKRRVVAYVESYDDVLFWRTVFNELHADDIQFDVMLPSRTSLGKGKKTVLMNHLGPDAFGSSMIACVDADYDFLMQGQTLASQAMLRNPYVFHTYVYAIENYQCYAPALHAACVMATLNDREIIDLEAYMREYSNIVWPLFVWNVWAYRYGYHKEFPLQDFEDEVSYRNVKVTHPEDTLMYVRRHVNRKIGWLQQHFPQGKKTYAPLRQELMELGLTPDTTYLYMQGHTLFEGVVIPLLAPICCQLRKEREYEIRHLACHETQMQNELSCYQHSQSPIDVMLRKSIGFVESPPFQRLKADLSRFVESLRDEAQQVPHSLQQA